MLAYRKVALSAVGLLVLAASAAAQLRERCALRVFQVIRDGGTWR